MYKKILRWEKKIPKNKPINIPMSKSKYGGKLAVQGNGENDKVTKPWFAAENHMTRTTIAVNKNNRKIDILA